MPSVTAVSVVAGPLTILGYLVSSLVHASFDRGGGEFDARRRGVIEALATLATVTVAWHVVRKLSPGSSLSAIARQADQVLVVWQSVALWVGAAAVLGHVAPVTRRFRGGSGIVPAVAVLFIYSPTIFMGAAAGALVGLALAPGGHGDVLPVALSVGVGTGWLAWIFDWYAGWGATNGPELSVWSTVVAGVLFARWWIDRHPAAPPQ